MVCISSRSVQVHADIKPDNLILVNNVLKVTDLGIAFRLDGNRQSVQRPMIRGTLGTYEDLQHLSTIFAPF